MAVAGDFPEDFETMDDQTLVAMARAGDNLPMEVLINRYKSLVRLKASALYMLGADSDDVIQEGMIGLFKAIRDYKPDQGASFATFANRCISAQITDAVRQASRQKHRPLNESISLQHLLYPEDTDRLAPVLDIPSPKDDPEQHLLSQEESDQLLEYLSMQLTELERQVIRLFMLGYSYRSIASELHCSPKRVDNALTRIRRKLGQFYAGKTRREAEKAT
ncbi:MAG: sigma-70 family RNA polymerase sigma factor [Clostridia bacterium]|nr:sigma-70 family RNA polymerase sigma factor [Clostridia bacterium]NCC76994.1 sigma-70 family RNA polymerase sigma factor [Clostridia bacterium]